MFKERLAILKHYLTLCYIDFDVRLNIFIDDMKNYIKDKLWYR